MKLKSKKNYTIMTIRYKLLRQKCLLISSTAVNTKLLRTHLSGPIWTHLPMLNKVNIDEKKRDVSLVDSVRITKKVKTGFKCK